MDAGQTAAFATPSEDDIKRRGARGFGRALSLDALRGLAILGMVLSGMVPFFQYTLPPWMYHAQMPPPEHAFRPDIPGITWVDVVFPLFLFALGAAIPLAMWSRLQSGASRLGLAWSALWRGILLLFFSLYKQHMIAGKLTEVYGSAGNLISMAAFAVLFLVLVRLPQRWSTWARICLRTAGWAAAIGLLALMQYPTGAGFTVHRHDIILAILANVVVTTSWLWLAWPERITGRMLMLAMVVALYAARIFAPWGVPFTELYWLKDAVGERIYNGLIWAINPTYQQYLVITLMGTVAGDFLLTWLRPVNTRLSFSIRHSRWRELSTLQCLGLAVVTVALCVGVIVGLSLYDRASTLLYIGIVSVIGLLLLFTAPARRRARGHSHVPAILFQQLYVWGVVCLAIGMALCTIEGIRKDPATLSFLFTTAGLAFIMLIFFSMITKALNRPGLLFLLIANGQNPMIAYVAAPMVIVPLLMLIPTTGGTSLLEWINLHTREPWSAFGRAVGLTLIVALFVWCFTRLKLFWRT